MLFHKNYTSFSWPGPLENHVFNHGKLATLPDTFYVSNSCRKLGEEPSSNSTTTEIVQTREKSVASFYIGPPFVAVYAPHHTRYYFLLPPSPPPCFCTHPLPPFTCRHPNALHEEAISKKGKKCAECKMSETFFLFKLGGYVARIPRKRSFNPKKKPNGKGKNVAMLLQLYGQLWRLFFAV